MRTTITKHTLYAVLVIVLFLLSSDLGLFSSYDGLVVAMVLSIFFPQYSIFLLIAVCVYQDSPGLSSWGWYLAFLFVSIILIKRNIKGVLKAITGNYLILFATVLIAYVILISAIYNYTGVFPQSPQRPYLIVGLLIYLMIISAYAGILELNKNAKYYNTLSVITALLLLHAIGVAVGQIFYGPLFLSSAYGSSAILESSQLIEASTLGIPRLTGTYNTPNGFAFCGILLSLIYYMSQENRKIGLKDALIYLTITLFFSVVAQSKALILFSLLSFIAFTFLMIQKQSIRYVLVLLVSIFVLLLLSVNSDISKSDFSTILSSFRAENIVDLKSFGYRSLAWSYVLTGLPDFAWLTGTGLSHWPIFFFEKLPFTLSDPHTFVLSYIGTFGLPGVMFFFYILFRILKRYHTASSQRKFLLIALLIILLVKDLVSTPYLLGNTPLTFLIWLLIFYALNKRTRDR